MVKFHHISVYQPVSIIHVGKQYTQINSCIINDIATSNNHNKTTSLIQMYHVFAWFANPVLIMCICIYVEEEHAMCTVL